MKEKLDYKEDYLIFEYIETLVATNYNDIWGNYSDKLKVVLGCVYHKFPDRYNKKDIDCKLTYEQYLKNDEIQRIVKGLDLDVDAFWLLILFCYDYSKDRGLNGIYSDHTYIDKFNEFIEETSKYVDSTYANCKEEMGFNNGVKLKSLTLNLDGINPIKLTDSRAVSLLLFFLRQGVQDVNDGAIQISVPYNSIKQIQITEKDNAIIYLFADTLRQFFDLQFGTKRAPKGINKRELISSLIYYTGLADHLGGKKENYLTSCDKLNGIFTQFSKKEFKGNSTIYYS